MIHLRMQSASLIEEGIRYNVIQRIATLRYCLRQASNDGERKTWTVDVPPLLFSRLFR